MRTLALIVTVLLSLPAFGQTWVTPDNQSAEQTPNVRPGLMFWYQFTSSLNADSPIVKNETSSLTVCFDPDTNATGVQAAEIYVRTCQSDTASANTCERLFVDNDGDGVLDAETLNGDNGATSGKQRRCIYGITEEALYIEVAVNPGAGDLARVTVKGDR